MILRGTERGELFIRADTLHGMRQDPSEHYNEVTISFSGFNLTLKREEINAILKGLSYLENHKYDHLVFINEGDHHQPKYKMMLWYYDPKKNLGGPIEIQSSTPTTRKEDE